MMKKVALVFFCFGPILWSAQSFACFAHMSMNGSLEGGIGGVNSAKRVFTLEHPQTVTAQIGEEAEIIVRYQRPSDSDNVKLMLKGIGKVNVLDKELPLPDLAGTVRVRFSIPAKGMSSVLIVVSGEHEGETVREPSAIYVFPAQPAGAEDMQVTTR